MKHTTITAIVIVLLSVQCTFDNEDDFFDDDKDSCSTENVLFSAQVNPVMEASCISCHNSSNPSGGINLSGYEHVKSAAQSGMLLGSIRHDEGFSKMPQLGNKLPDCTIAQIEAWIAQGMKNN
jgi:hypothetical protein